MRRQEDLRRFMLSRLDQAFALYVRLLAFALASLNHPPLARKRRSFNLGGFGFRLVRNPQVGERS
jgi:hypothetical protein